MSDQEAKEIEAKAREIMPQPSTKSTAASTVNLQSQHHSLLDTYWNWMAAMVSRVLELRVSIRLPWTNSPPEGWTNSPLEGWTNSPWTNSPPKGWNNSPPKGLTNSPLEE
ncbi:hypothetical protein Tco_0213110 [Tanacetum coccineum]